MLKIYELLNNNLVATSSLNLFEEISKQFSKRMNSLANKIDNCDTNIKNLQQSYWFKMEVFAKNN